MEVVDDDDDDDDDEDEEDDDDVDAMVIFLKHSEIWTILRLGEDCPYFRVTRKLNIASSS